MRKVQISIDEDLLERIDNMAAALYTNRSAYISMTMAQVLNNQEKVMGLIETATGKALEQKKNEE